MPVPNGLPVLVLMSTERFRLQVREQPSAKAKYQELCCCAEPKYIACVDQNSSSLWLGALNLLNADAQCWVAHNADHCKWRVVVPAGFSKRRCKRPPGSRQRSSFPPRASRAPSLAISSRMASMALGKRDHSQSATRCDQRRVALQGCQLSGRGLLNGHAGAQSQELSTVRDPCSTAALARCTFCAGAIAAPPLCPAVAANHTTVALHRAAGPSLPLPPKPSQPSPIRPTHYNTASRPAPFPTVLSLLPPLRLAAPGTTLTHCSSSRAGVRAGRTATRAAAPGPAAATQATATTGGGSSS